MTTVAIKYRATTHTVPIGTVEAIKLALEAPTGVAVAEMSLIHRGKVLKDCTEPPAGSKLMLMRSAAKVIDARPVPVTFRDIITGRSATVEAPPSTKHDDLTALALKVLGCPPEGAACLRLFLPHASSLMRIDLALSDYLPGGAAASADHDAPALLYLIPCAPGLRLDAAVSAEAVAEAARAELEATAMARAQIEDQMEAELMRHAMPALLPQSIADVVGEQSASKEVPSASAPSAASFVPARIRTGLMASMEDVAVVQLPMQALADLQAFDAYDAEMRTFSELPPHEARELMVAAEEARLEERCAMLVSTLEPCSTAVAEPVARPPTPAGLPRGSAPGGWREGVAPALPAALPPQLVSGSRLGGGHGRVGGSFCDEIALSEELCLELGDGSEWSEWSRCRVADDDSTPADRSVVMTTTPKAAARKGRKHCKSCACRLSLTASVTAACACGELYCPAHMHAHECSFDFRTPEQRKLSKGNPKCEHSKLERL